MDKIAMDEIWQRDEIESPCVKICQINPAHNYCMGCGRSAEEITNWSKLSPSERKAIKNLLAERLEAMKPKRRGGRKRP